MIVKRSTRDEVMARLKAKIKQKKPLFFASCGTGLTAKLLEKAGAVVMVSHDLNLASLFASRILLLRQGRKILAGTPAEIMTPEHLEQAYGCTMHVDTHPSAGRPRISLVP